MGSRSAKPRDLGQELDDLKTLVRRLMTGAMTRPPLRVTAGDFEVTGGGSVVVEDGGDVAVNDGGDLNVNDGGNVNVLDGGNVYVLDSGRVLVYGTDSLGTLEDGRFGMVSLDGGGAPTYPSFLATVDGFLADAGPGLGYAVFRVDETSGAAVIASSINEVYLTHTTTSSSANTVINAITGLIQRSTSSRRYKTNIKDIKIDPAAVLQLRPRRWRDKSDIKADPDTTHEYVGFIAEELVEAGLDMFVDFDEEGRPDAIQYDRLSVALVQVAKDQETRLQGLEVRLSVLESTKTVVKDVAKAATTKTSKSGDTT